MYFYDFMHIHVCLYIYIYMFSRVCKLKTLAGLIRYINLTLGALTAQLWRMLQFS